MGIDFLVFILVFQTDFQNWVRTKIGAWVNSIHAQSEAAELQPQASFVVLRNHYKLKEHLYTELFLILMAFFNQLRTAVASPIYS